MSFVRVYLHKSHITTKPNPKTQTTEKKSIVQTSEQPCNANSLLLQI